MKRHLFLTALQLALSPAFITVPDNRKIATFTFADLPVPSVAKVTSLSSKDSVNKTFRALREQGFTDVYWRVSGEGHPIANLYYFNSAAIEQMTAAAREYEKTAYAWDPYELRWPVEV